MHPSSATGRRNASSWLTIARLIALGCVGAHALALILEPDTVGVVMTCISAWCLWHLSRAHLDSIGRASAGLASGAFLMLLIHLAGHQFHGHMEPGSMHEGGSHSADLLSHLGLSLAATQLLFAGIGRVRYQRPKDWSHHEVR